MKRIILSTVVVVLAVVLIGPFVMGSIAEKNVRQYYQNIDKHTDVKVRFTDFKRGWLSSSTVMKLGVDIPDERIPNFELEMSAEIAHGPVIVGHGGGIRLGVAGMTYRVKLADQLRMMAKPFIGEQDVFSTTTFFSFRDVVNSQWQSAKVKFSQPLMNAEVTWDGIFGDFNTDKTITKLKGTTTLGAFKGKLMVPNIGNASYSFHSHPMIAEVDVERVLPQIMVGTTAIHWPGMRFDSPKASEKFSLSNFKMNLNDNYTDSKLNYSMAMSVDDIQFAGTHRLRQLDFQLDMLNLDGPALSELVEKLTKLPDTAMTDGLSSADQKEFERLGVQLLSHGIVIHLKRFAFELNNENMEARARAALPPISSMHQLGPELLNQIQASLYVRVPASWPEEALVTAITQKLRTERLKERGVSHQFMQMQHGGATPGMPAPRLLGKSDAELNQLAQKQVQGLLAQALAEGLLVKQNDQYVLDYVYDKGKLTLNGKEVPVMNLVQQLVQMQQSQQAASAPAMGASAPNIPASTPATAQPMPTMPAMPTNPTEIEPTTTTPNMDQNQNVDDLLEQQQKMLEQLERQQKEELEKLNQQLEEMQ